MEIANFEYVFLPVTHTILNLVSKLLGGYGAIEVSHVYSSQKDTHSILTLADKFCMYVT